MGVGDRVSGWESGDGWVKSRLSVGGESLSLLALCRYMKAVVFAFAMGRFGV
jgi:hypothetical protein